MALESSRRRRWINSTVQNLRELVFPSRTVRFLLILHEVCVPSCYHRSTYGHSLLLLPTPQVLGTLAVANHNLASILFGIKDSYMDSSKRLS
jgi:hypothetical protein